MGWLDVLLPLFLLSADASISGDHQFLTRTDYSSIFILDVIPYCCLPVHIINIF